MKNTKMSVLLSVLMLGASAFGDFQVSESLPLEQMRTLYDRSSEPASMEDLRGDYPIHIGKSCIVVSSATGQSHIVGLWVEKTPSTYLRGPVFNDPEELLVFNPKLGAGRTGFSYPEPFTLSNECTTTERIFRGKYQVSVNDVNLWAQSEFSFRKSGDLIAFKFNFEGAKEPAYGYCWPKP